MESKLIAYALDFTSFLIQKSTHPHHIKEVILFGSAARGDAGPDSDVDLFINTIKDHPLQEECESILQRFNKSSKVKNYWKPLGILNPIKLTVGVLDRWESFKPSIVANGITLYGKFKSDVKGSHMTFLVWENVKPNATRVALNKKLFGFSQQKKHYAGLVELFNGEKLGKGSIMIPAEHAQEAIRLFRKFKAAVKIKQVKKFTCSRLPWAKSHGFTPLASKR